MEVLDDLPRRGETERPIIQFPRKARSPSASMSRRRSRRSPSDIDQIVLSFKTSSRIAGPRSAEYCWNSKKSVDNSGSKYGESGRLCPGNKISQIANH